MPTTMDCSKLTQPIDAMYLIHKALRTEAGRVEGAVNALEMGGSFKPFQRAFYRWAMALGYHMEAEEHYFTAWLSDTRLLQEQEGEQRHVLAMLDDLQTYLHEDLGRMIVIPRTQRQLRSKVIVLGIAQDDLLEMEEERVLPMIRQYSTTAQQLELMHCLLLQEEAEAQGGVPDWVAQDLTPPEQQWLAALCSRQVSGAQ